MREAQPIVTRHQVRAMRARDERIRVLLAEDNLGEPESRRRTVLEKIGLARRTSRPTAARPSLPGRAVSFDVILMDCQMPEMRWLRGHASDPRAASPASHRTPIIALTAHAMKGADEECRAAGMNDYVTKPIDSEILRACILRHCGES